MGCPLLLPVTAAAAVVLVEEKDAETAGTRDAVLEIARAKPIMILFQGSCREYRNVKLGCLLYCLTLSTEEGKQGREGMEE